MKNLTEKLLKNLIYSEFQRIARKENKPSLVINAKK